MKALKTPPPEQECAEPAPGFLFVANSCNLLGMQTPSSKEYAEYYSDYVKRVPEGDICEILDKQGRELREVFARFSEQRASAPRIEKEWTLKEVLGHLCDGERVFGYRACRISRGDKTPLEGFEQDDLVAGGSFNQRGLRGLLTEFEHLRAANVAMFREMTEEQSAQIGTASSYPVSARALAYIIAGHTGRHLELIRKRFLD
jgi:hypothetical protein